MKTNRKGYYDNLTAMSVALFESPLMIHSFVDGNKRVAFFATDIFLRLNDYRIKVDSNSAHRFIADLLESNQVDFDALRDWIKLHI